MSSQTHRIAIAGVGGISAMHAHSIAELPNAQLVAGCCRTAQKGRAFAETHGCAWHPDVEQMLDTERPDVLCITTPSGAHLPPAEAAFARGVHVLCEKPLEITTERVDAMIEHAREAGVTLGGIFPQRFNPACQPLFEAAREGRFGAPASVQAAVPWWRDDAYYAPQRWQGTRALDGGGALMNQSIHDVDLVQWLGGAAARGAGASVSETENPVAEVFAYTGRRGHDAALLEVEDTAVVVLRHQDGGLGQILASTALYPGTSKRFQIGGRFGTAELVGDRLSCYHFAKERAEDERARAEHGEAEAPGGASDPLAIGHANHRRNIAAFLESLDRGAPFALPGPEARKAVAIIEAAYASAERGAPVAPK